MRVVLASEMRKSHCQSRSITSCYWKDENNNPVFNVPERTSTPEVATDLECRSRLRQHPAFFLRTCRL